MKKYNRKEHKLKEHPTIRKCPNCKRRVSILTLWCCLCGWSLFSKKNDFLDEEDYNNEISNNRT